MVLRIPDDAYAPLPPVNLGIQSGRHQYAPEGFFGGGEGAKASFLVNGEPGNPYGLSQLKPGDVVTMDAAGGGGYGDPLERELERVEADVREGYVSLDAAERDYGVIIDPSTGIADGAATERMRETLRG
jgi:N-methylhydantoinase B